MRLSKENREALVTSYIDAMERKLTDEQYRAEYEYSNLTDAQMALDLGEFLFLERTSQKLARGFKTSYRTDRPQ